MRRLKLIFSTFFLTLSILAIPAGATVEISDFFSDFTSSDVVIYSNQDFYGKAVFELFYEPDKPVESHEIPISIKARESASKVIIWDTKPLHDYYTAKVSIYEGSKLLASKSYQISYGTVTLPGFHVIDFSPTNSGVKLLIRPFNPSAADIRIEMLDEHDIVYTKTLEDVSLTTNTELNPVWPFLLADNKEYAIRSKIFTHRLYAPPLINTYIAYFKAGQDVEILSEDVQVDEYGASVTILGKSQVPFDGNVVVTARSRSTNETHTYRTQMEEILVTGKEDTAGIVWKGLSSGVYDVEILAVNKENVTIDKYQTVLRIPDIPVSAAATAVKNSPDFGALMVIIILFVLAKRI